MVAENVLPRFVVDVSAFQKAAKELRASKTTLGRDLLVRLRAIGDIVACDARSRAGEASQSIPPSIKVRVRGLTVSVLAGGPGVPLAGLFELGNKDPAKGGQAGRFRAPNFPPKGSHGQAAFARGGHFQPMHPFLGPAGDAHEREVEEAAYEALDAVFGGAYLARR